MTAPAMADTGDDYDARLFQPAYRALAIGAVALVTLGAFENRAVTTALPSIVQEMNAIGTLGVINAAPIASYVASLAFTGLWADRRGPVGPLQVGVLLFAVAQIAIGSAGHVGQVIAGRITSGVAEGLLDVSLMVLIARVVPEELRPKMFSLFAAAWILPSVVGPFVTGIITEAAGWRWVFLGAIGVLVPTWLLIQPVLRQHRDVLTAGAAEDPSVPGARRILPWALIAGSGVFGLTIAGGELDAHTVGASVAIAILLIATALGARGLLPSGTFRFRAGLPRVIAVRGLVGMAFAGAGAWLPILLTLERGYRPSITGVSLTITGVMWAFGSWLQSRDHGLSRERVLRWGLTVMTVGLAVTTLLAWTSWPAAVGLAGWAIAGIGMGLTNPTMSMLILSASDETNQGRNSSAGQMASSLGIAMSLAVSGSLVAFTEPDPGPIVFGVILTGAAAAALVAAIASRRVTSPR